MSSRRTSRVGGGKLETSSSSSTQPPIANRATTARSTSRRPPLQHNSDSNNKLPSSRSNQNSARSPLRPLTTNTTSRRNSHLFTTTSDTNRYSLPKTSHKYGCALKTIFLDPLNNPIPQSSTLTSYRQKMKLLNMPHISNDIDGDGSVSAQDLFLAKQFDLDNNGIIDDDERGILRQVVSEQFFKCHTNETDLCLFGDEYLSRSYENNVKNLIGDVGDDEGFKKRITRLKTIEHSIKNSASTSMKSILTVVNPEVIKHNYYTNKLNTTAWNDWGAPGPRAKNFHEKQDHNGSRDMYKSMILNKDRYNCQTLLDNANTRELISKPWLCNSFNGSDKSVMDASIGRGEKYEPKMTSVKRRAYITDFRVENTSRLA